MPDPLASTPERTSSPAETEEVGARLASELSPGDVVLVSGELGTGKTTLIRGACRALGVTDPVTSPTFTIGHRYRGHVSVSHLDLYRLAGLDAEEPGLLEDYLTPDAIAFVEWPGAAETEVITNDTSQFRGLKPPHRHTRVTMRVELKHDDGDHRLITVRRQ